MYVRCVSQTVFIKFPQNLNKLAKNPEPRTENQLQLVHTHTDNKGFNMMAKCKTENEPEFDLTRINNDQCLFSNQHRGVKSVTSSNRAKCFQRKQTAADRFTWSFSVFSLFKHKLFFVWAFLFRKCPAAAASFISNTDKLVKYFKDTEHPDSTMISTLTTPVWYSGQCCTVFRSFYSLLYFAVTCV